MSLRREESISHEAVLISANYAASRLGMFALNSYATPPHEPVPELPNLTPEAKLMLAEESGINLSQKWAETFASTISACESYYEALKETSMPLDDLRKITASQYRVVNAFVRTINLAAENS